jgi:ABC-type glycerol-3-phosphate transport system substrate-binding protein
VRALAAVALVLVALAGCGGDEPLPAGVEDLEGLSSLREDFEAQAGKARVVLLLAPT